jgi:predicted acyl esterase
MTDTDQAQVTDGMTIEWDVPIEMDDGLQLRADIFRPIGPGPGDARIQVDGRIIAGRISPRRSPDSAGCHAAA